MKNMAGAVRKISISCGSCQQDQNDAKHISVYGSMLLLPCAEHCNTVGNKQYQQKDHTGYTVVKDRNIAFVLILSCS